MLALAYPYGTVVLIDRALPGHFLPEGQGVGLARKIGNDLALALHAEGRIASPWIHNTDADTLLANDYFDQTEPIAEDGNAAALYFFEHRFGDGREPRPRRRGSTRSRCATTRSASRGPARRTPTRRWAAASPSARKRTRRFADFRARTRPRTSTSSTSSPRSARSRAWRARRCCSRGASRTASPSARARRSRTSLAKKKALSGFKLYHPAVFGHLAAWLRVLDAVAESGGRMEAALDELPRGNPFFKTEALLASLEKMEAIEAMREAIGRSGGDAATMRRHFHTWFDAFRTLKLVHALRDGGLPLDAVAPGAGGGALHRTLRLDAGRARGAAPRARRRGAHAGRRVRPRVEA